MSKSRVTCKAKTHSGSARERRRVVVHVILALHAADREHTGIGVNIESPISNGLTAVAAEADCDQ